MKKRIVNSSRASNFVARPGSLGGISLCKSLVSRGPNSEIKHHTNNLIFPGATFEKHLQRTSCQSN